ncbi:MAG TPA: hypothetical protein VFO67_08800 [Gemmatimonadales bacterium]|nr:hypothetical protein [Gemmatimonadales bacterium]
MVVALVFVAACRQGPRVVTLARTWQAAGGTTVSVAAWSADSQALRRAIEQVRDSMQAFDSAQSRPAMRRIWLSAREHLRVTPEWRDVLDSYSLDRAVSPLVAVADSALFDLGGQFLWIGPATRRGVGIADPDNSLDLVAQVELREGSISTVIGEHRSVSALGADAFIASAWASALFSVGCDEALALAARRRISVVCVDSAGVRWSPGLQNRVALLPGRVR